MGLQGLEGRPVPEDLPQRRWLKRYAEVFDTVEVNNTFYRLPTLAAVERWAEETPANFVFAVKGSRYTTHVKRLIDFPRYWSASSSGSSRSSPQGSSGRSFGSSRRTSGGTTSAWRAPWRRSGTVPAGTRSSSATRPGSSSTSTRGSASTMRRS